MVKTCVSCGSKVVEGTKFPCPKCGMPLQRCKKCKTTGVVYACECGFTGP
ncbi:MAG: zinc finger domain-containing protein [Candidatus Micrarchaeota archaeon]